MKISYSVNNNTSIFFEESGVSERIRTAYSEIIKGNKVKFLPLLTRSVLVKAGQIVTVIYGEPQKIDIPLEAFLKFSEKIWSNLTVRVIEIIISNDKFNGEVVAYDATIPTLSFAATDLKLLKKEE